MLGQMGLNPLPQNPNFKQPWETKPSKTLLEKEIMLVTSGDSFVTFYYTVPCEVSF